MLPIAYQIYSARKEAEKDLEHVFEKISQIGYNGVEFAGFYGKSTDEIKALLQKYHLQAISSHVPVEALQKDPFGTIAYHQQIGCKYIAIPYLDEKSRPGGPAFAAALKWIRKMGKLCKKGSISLLYHNHDFEFDLLSGQYGLDFMYDAIEAKHLGAEVDTCWVHYAGVNPSEYLKKLGSRVPLVHMKDYVGKKTDEGSPYGLLGAGEANEVPFMYKPLGKGINDIKAIAQTAKEIGAKWFVVEMDESVEMPPLEAAKISYDFLKPLA